MINTTQSEQTSILTADSVTIHRLDVNYRTILMVVMTLSAFGPYLVGSIRTEQLAIYALATLAILLGWFHFTQYAGWLFLIPWSLLFMVSVLGVVFPYRGPMPWGFSSLLAGLDNLLLPIAVMIVVWTAFQPSEAPYLFTVAARTIVFAVAVNSVLAIISIRVDLTPFLQMFWSSTSGSSVALRAASTGRLSGIFNQPAEAGLAYGIAGLLAVYLLYNRPVRLVSIAALIIIGGLLSVSKIFLYGGIPLMIIYWWRTSRDNRLLSIFASLFAAIIVIQSGIFREWSGSDRLSSRLAVSSENTSDPLTVYTAGRWNEASNLMEVIRSVLEVSPLTGVGARAWRVAYDSGWVEALLVAGLIGVVCHLLIIVGTIKVAVSQPSRQLRQFSLVFAIFLLGASFGISSFTANRIATMVWVLISLLVLCAQSPGEGSADRRTIPTTRQPRA